MVVDLQPHAGKAIYIRVEDRHTGPWGHINFDDFRFHRERPQFRNERDPVKEAKDAPPPADVVRFAGLSAEAAAKEITLPPGFSANLFAGEHDFHSRVEWVSAQDMDKAVEVIVQLCSVWWESPG